MSESAIAKMRMLCYNTKALYRGTGEEHCCQAFQKNFLEKFLEHDLNDSRRLDGHGYEEHHSKDTSLPLKYIIFENCETLDSWCIETHTLW